MTEDESTGWRQESHGIWAILGRKWTVQILRLLSTEDRRFNELRAELDSVTASTLSRRLKQLEAAGVVTREVFETSPPRTNYALTERGERLVDLLIEIERLRPFSDS
jgi:DNA-binding HxlR family transcriptional regulator